MAANKYFEYLKQQKDRDYYDPCYSLIPDIVKMYSKVSEAELTIQDVTVLYMMTIYSDPSDKKGRSQIHHKIEDVEKSHLPDKNKREIISRLKKYGELEDERHIGLFAIAKQVIGDEKTYPNNHDAGALIALCIDIKQSYDEEKKLQLVESRLPSLKLPGVGMGILSQILHCLNPRIFPVLNGPGVQNYKENLGLTLSKKSGFEAYIENIEIIRKFRDENFSFKNYRIIDTMGWEIEEWEKGGGSSTAGSPSEDKSWKPEIVGLMATDSTGWHDGYIKEIKAGGYNATILWNSKTPVGTDHTMQLLRELLDQRGSFYLYYTVKDQVTYRAKIIDFVRNQSELQSKKWNQEYSIYGYSEKFSDYSDKPRNLSAKIVFLGEELEKIKPIPLSAFTFYSDYKDPTQDHLVPVATEVKDVVVVESSQKLQGEVDTSEPVKDRQAWIFEIPETKLRDNFKEFESLSHFVFDHEIKLFKDNDIIVYWIKHKGIAGWGLVDIGQDETAKAFNWVLVNNGVLLDNNIVQEEIDKGGYFNNLQISKVQPASQDTDIKIYKLEESILPSLITFIQLKTGINFPGSDPIAPKGADAKTDGASIDDNKKAANQYQTVNPMADKPASVDQLRRRPFANSIADKLQILWEDNRETESDAPVMVHMHGPWGSGKSSLINFIKDSLWKLRPPIRPRDIFDKHYHWHIVEFNAWQNQHIDPPWWALYSEIRKEGRKGAKQYLWNLISYFNRVFKNKAPYIFGLAVISILIYFLNQVIPTLDSEGRKVLGKGLPEQLKTVNGIIALVSSVASLLIAFGRSIFLTSSDNATEFIQEKNSPMNVIRKKFKRMMANSTYPVLVVIDDMDRCHTEYTVKLLEGIQTLLASKNVIYLVVADRRWLYSCYERVYDQFKDNIKEPGKQLGAHFLEKAFDFSFPVPVITDEMRKEYWKYLIGIKENEKRGDSPDQEKNREQEFEQAKQEYLEKFQNAKSEDEIFHGDEEVEEMEDSQEKFIKTQARREAQVEAISKRKGEEAIEHFLLQFWELVEPNPRAMKRLLNAYTIQASLAILAGLDLKNEERRKQLVLFTIITLRWPDLEREIANDIKIVDQIKKKEIPEQHTYNEEIKKLILDPEVQRVFGGDGIGVDLDTEAVQLFRNLQTEGKVDSSVA